MHSIIFSPMIRADKSPSANGLAIIRLLHLHAASWRRLGRKSTYHHARQKKYRVYSWRRLGDGNLPTTTHGRKNIGCLPQIPPSTRAKLTHVLSVAKKVSGNLNNNDGFLISVTHGFACLLAVQTAVVVVLLFFLPEPQRNLI